MASNQSELDSVQHSVVVRRATKHTALQVELRFFVNLTSKLCYNVEST